MKKNLIIILLFCVILSANANLLSKSTLNKITLIEYIVVNDEFNKILNALLEEFEQCSNIEKAYHFTITIQEINDTTNVKSLYISRSYYKDFVSLDGYGFIYYKGYVFVLIGAQLNDCFKKTSNEFLFPYKEEPISTFDPSRWLYFYWNSKFYLAYSSHCGG